MPEFDERLDALQDRLDNLLKSQEFFQREIGQIKYEINVLRAVQQKRRNLSQAEPQTKTPTNTEYIPPKQPINDAEYVKTESETRQTPPPNFSENITPRQPHPGFFSSDQNPKTASKTNLERFIGENLISKIGILILIIGVAIGAKYAIDNNLISPLTRIIIGYAFGFGLFGFAFKLREKYLNFSAVLLSGAMAIMYFITFFAHSLYEIFNQTTTFVLMLIFTAFTVAAAISFSRQVIANIGLVGAYAIPFLLSNNSGNFVFLFSYVAIINIGILAISIRKYWKSLFYLSFVFTWAIFFGWYLFDYRTADHFNLALLFLTINFLSFYLTFLAYKLVSHQSVAIENIGLILSNSFIFYGFGYSIFNSREGFENYLGLFTLGNAAIHFVFAFAVSRMKLVSKDLVYLLAALVLTFITIAVPVQLDGQIVTLVWTAEAAILFWIGRTKMIQLYEYYSFPLMILASFSLLYDLQSTFYYDTAQKIIENYYPFFNGIFLTSIIFAIAFAFIFAVNRDTKYEPGVNEQIRQALNYLIPAVALIVFYNAFRMEISNYFNLQYLQSEIPGSQANFSPPKIYNYDLKTFSFLWQLNYSMLFLTILAFVNIRKFKNIFTALTTQILSFFVMAVFLTAGLYFLGDLRQNFLSQEYGAVYIQSNFYILIRYICYAFVAALLFSFYKTLKQDFLKEIISQANFLFDIVLYLTALLVLTAELITWTEIFGYSDSFKLVTSIFWGIYAVGLIVLGIYQNKKYLRVGGIILFAITLAKLFLYDIAELGTISKTIVFVSLGILLLIASFLYNKYKSLIFETG
ncbi:DUF2339 domain-containing protein [soil metagenome]